MLVDFIFNFCNVTNYEEKIKTIDNLNKDLLIAQLKAMEAYLSVLSIRIGLNAPREMVDTIAPKEASVTEESE